MRVTLLMGRRQRGGTGGNYEPTYETRKPLIRAGRDGVSELSPDGRPLTYARSGYDVQRLRFCASAACGS